MSDDSYIIRQLKGIDRRIGQTEVKEVPFSGIGAIVYNNAAISIPSGGGGTFLTFNSERYDPDGMHSLVLNTGRFTITRAGVHLVGFAGEFESNATGYRQIGIFANGTTNIAIDTRPAVSGTTTSFAFSRMWNFSVGDFVEVYAFQNSGVALNINASGSWSPEFWIQRCP